MAKKRRFHRQRSVRLHASGRWSCTIGQVLSSKRGKLCDKDWYFDGDEANAKRQANAIARQWELLVGSWNHTERPSLELLGEPFPDEPRWPEKGSKRPPAGGGDPAATADDSVDPEDFSTAYAEYSLTDLIAPFAAERVRDVNSGELNHSSHTKLIRQIRLAAAFFPSDVPAVNLRALHFRTAKQKMFEKALGKRTVKNYLFAAFQLLKWAYTNHGGSDARLPLGIEDVITIKLATNTRITVYGVEELKIVAKAVAGTISELDFLLALNCGMYEADIGRLMFDELDLREGSAFWDREKEPANEFRIHHLFWPETLIVVKKYLHDGSIRNEYNDFRRGKVNDFIYNTKNLAFLDGKGRARYTIKPGGSAQDRVGKSWGDRNLGVQFRNLRKSANEVLVSLISHEGSTDELAAATEVSKQFLGEKTDTLARLYRTNGKAVYRRMNRYLLKLGDHFRAAGLFASMNL